MVLISKNCDADESSIDCCLSWLTLTLALLESTVCNIEIISFPSSVSMWSAIYLTVHEAIVKNAMLLTFYHDFTLKYSSN
jgi:hypothetical protein